MALNARNILCKAISLERNLKAYSTGTKEQRKEVRDKFVEVWGTLTADHFLVKYSDAKDLIWALDGDNIQLFYKKF